MWYVRTDHFCRPSRPRLQLVSLNNVCLAYKTWRNSKPTSDVTQTRRHRQCCAVLPNEQLYCSRTAVVSTLLVGCTKEQTRCLITQHARYKMDILKLCLSVCMHIRPYGWRLKPRSIDDFFLYLLYPMKHICTSSKAHFAAPPGCLDDSNMR
jgi:hypothetical protein